MMIVPLGLMAEDVLSEERLGYLLDIMEKARQ